MEKTAMQELMKELDMYLPQHFVMWVRKNKDYLLSLERQQIEIAWIDGKENQSFGDNIEDDASKYFTKKYGQ